jgi:DNA-directed RNA polymerase II subunit RPB2
MSSVEDLPFRVLNAYYEQNPLFLTRHHIDSYEHFVFNEMPQMIYSENPITILKNPISASEGIYKYKTEIYLGGRAESAADLRIDIGAPIITLDAGNTVRRMYPNEARLRGLTYASQIRLDIDIVVTRTEKRGENYDTIEKVIPLKNFQLLRLPILLRSKLCSLGVESTDEAFYQKGESPHEQGGYFIIDGAEKLLVTRQEQAFNSMYVARKNPTDLEVSVYASVVSQHPETKMNRRASVFLMREDSVFRVSIPSVRGPVPLFVVFRALGVESDHDIVRMIFPDANSEFTKLYEDLLIPSVEDAWPITTQAMAIQFISTLTHQGTVASVLDIIRNHLFSHVPNKPMARAFYLGDMVQRIIKTNAKITANTDRDDIRNQRLLTTGTLLRDLFSAVWKDWRKAVMLAVDKKYNYNTTLYEGEKFIEIFAPGNIVDIFQTDLLNTSLMRGFRGKWGTSAANTKTGVLQPVARISYLDAMSHCRRILLDFDTSLKQKGPRHLHPSQLGYFCTNETPTGAHIGVSKNFSMMTYVSIASPVKPIMDWLEQKGGVIPVALSDRRLRSIGTLVRINSGVIGFVEDPAKLLRVLKLMKWTACLPPMVSISLTAMERELNIYLDEGRPLRPLWHLEEGGQWTELAKLVLAEPQITPNWRNLVLGTLPLTTGRTVNDVSFIDPLIDHPEGNLDAYIATLTPFIGAIEYVDPYESNEAYISWYGSTDLSAQHTHVELHPSTMSGLMVSLIPFYNHNQSPRNQLSCSQSKQGIGYYATNYLQRYDTYGSQLCYGEAPLVRSLVQDHVARGSNSYGYNCIVAMASTDGYNQDDGILFNRSSVERGLFRHLALRSYEGLEEIDSISKVMYKIANPKMIPGWTSLRAGHDYSKLDESGIITVGTAITDTTVLVGRYLENPETHEMKDASVLPTIFTKGRVESVVVLNQANGMKLVKVRILQERIPELGDKFGSRHGQKGTMGMLIPAENMPHTAEGIIPDVIVNPHGLTSRMTVAQVIEVLFGRLGSEVASKCNGTAFCNRENIVKTVGDSLMELGLHPHTENIMYCGTTGKQLNCSIFMGPLYFMRMKHLTSDKINSRAEGRREIRTHQPTGGRGNEGGMRIGEMERDAVLAHGVSLFLQESMMKRADGTSFWVCNGCGSIPIANERENLFVCSTCDGPVEFSGSTVETMTLIQPLKRSRVTFSKIEMPYALKLLDQELTTFMGSGMRFVTSKTVGRLKENFLEWASAPSEGGGATPLPPISYQETVKQAVEVARTAELVPDNQLPAAEKTTIYLDPALVGTKTNNFVITQPSLEQKLVDFSDGIESAVPNKELARFPDGSELPKVGGRTNVIGYNDNAVEKLIELKQQMGGAPVDSLGKDTVPLKQQVDLAPQCGGEAPVDSIGHDMTPIKQDLEETWASPSTDLQSQTGGEAPVDSIGHDMAPVQQVFEDWHPPVNAEPKSILKQTGGMAPLNPEPIAPLSMGGTDIDSKIFSQPALGQEPYVIANPFVSPPLTATEMKPEAPQYTPVPATIEQPVQGSQGITNAINLFENSEIRVIKLA